MTLILLLADFLYYIHSYSQGRYFHQMYQSLFHHWFLLNIRQCSALPIFVACLRVASFLSYALSDAILDGTTTRFALQILRFEICASSYALLINRFKFNASLVFTRSAQSVSFSFSFESFLRIFEMKEIHFSACLYSLRIEPKTYVYWIFHFWLVRVV